MIIYKNNYKKSFFDKFIGKRVKKDKDRKKNKKYINFYDQNKMALHFKKVHC